MSGNPIVKFHQNDIPDNLKIKNFVSIDTEAMGLKYYYKNRDRLCLIQLASEDGVCHLVQVDKDNRKAPNLKKILADKNIIKICHYARFDIGILYHNYGVMAKNIYCTKIASRLCRTYSDRHSLKELCRSLLKVELQKQEQISDWGNTDLTHSQQLYAARDVLHLNDLRLKLDELLKRENRYKLFRECCDFLPTRIKLDIMGWEGTDIFIHH